jgi:hypothetical protein
MRLNRRETQARGLAGFLVSPLALRYVKDDHYHYSSKLLCGSGTVPAE